MMFAEKNRTVCKMLYNVRACSHFTIIFENVLRRWLIKEQEVNHVSEPGPYSVGERLSVWTESPSKPQHS